jgi:hypothetical protein
MIQCAAGAAPACGRETRHSPPVKQKMRCQCVSDTHRQPQRPRTRQMSQRRPHQWIHQMLHHRRHQLRQRRRLLHHPRSSADDDACWHLQERRMRSWTCSVVEARCALLDPPAPPPPLLGAATVLWCSGISSTRLALAGCRHVAQLGTLNGLQWAGQQLVRCPPRPYEVHHASTSSSHMQSSDVQQSNSSAAKQPSAHPLVHCSTLATWLDTLPPISPPLALARVLLKPAACRTPIGPEGGPPRG